MIRAIIWLFCQFSCLATVIRCTNHHSDFQQNTELNGSPGASPATAAAKPRIFVRTPENSMGNMGGVLGADALCQSSAAKPGVGNYKALLADGTRRACLTANCSTESENLNWVMRPNTTYYQSDGETVIATTNAAGIFTFPLLNPVVGLGHPNYTGLNADWTTGSHCSNWTNSSSAMNGTLGFADSTAAGAFAQMTIPCDSGIHIYCVEQ